MPDGVRAATGAACAEERLDDARGRRWPRRAPTPARREPGPLHDPAAVRRGGVQHAEHRRVVELEVAQRRHLQDRGGPGDAERPRRRRGAAPRAPRRSRRAPRGRRRCRAARTAGSTSANTTARTMSVVELAAAQGGVHRTTVRGAGRRRSAGAGGGIIRSRVGSLDRPQKPRRPSCFGSRCQSFATFTCRAR